MTNLKNQLSTVLVIITNLIPVVGVAWYGWQLMDVVILFWVEAMIIFVYAIARSIIAGRYQHSRRLGSAIAVSVGLLIIFILQLMALFEFFVPDLQSLIDWQIFGRAVVTSMLAIGAMLVTHGITFFSAFIGTRAYTQIDPVRPLGTAGASMVIIQASIMAVGLAIAPGGGAVGGLIALIIVKTLAELLGPKIIGKITFFPKRMPVDQGKI